ncbi:F-box domain protein [Dictyocaulus viviparus]|uniref:F-box domain protein n=1 Tax=Dictyocaulus viviparus TaxID=29172 RepID=A0A0D8XHU8_DICVI|nr:F-box domain protein [Dictyocaulus viviparus]
MVLKSMNLFRLEDLPNEILLKIMTYCDFTSKMNTRALNYRFYSLIEKGAHNLPRRNLVGGVEIKHCGPNLQDNLNAVVSSSIAYPGFHLTLSRPLKHIEILVPATRLTNIMRHVCVCHSLKLCGVSLDEVLASNILDASFRTVSDVIIDHVDTVTAETLSRLVNKACPSNKLIFCNHSTRKASDAIVPELLLSCPAKNVTILPRNTLLHHNFDDAALVRLVVSDHVIRRVVRLPICAITHHGINHAAQVFYKRCCDLMEEWTTEMNAPRWEISIFFPYSIMIDRNLIKVPAEMRDQCIIWGFKSQQNNSFIVE